MKKVLFLSAIIFAVLRFPAIAQEEDPPTDSIPTAPVDPFEQLSRNALEATLAVYPADSYIRARIHKLHGRWYTFWKTKVCLDAPDTVSMFAPAAMAHQYMITPVTGPGIDDGSVIAEPPTWPPKNPGHLVCLDNVNGGNWQFIGPKYDHYNKTRG